MWPGDYKPPTVSGGKECRWKSDLFPLHVVRKQWCVHNPLPMNWSCSFNVYRLLSILLEKVSSFYARVFSFKWSDSHITLMLGCELQRQRNYLTHSSTLAITSGNSHWSMRNFTSFSKFYYNIHREDISTKLIRKIDHIQRLSVNRFKLEETSEHTPQWTNEGAHGPLWTDSP